MAKLKRFPAAACEYFVRGRCIVEERANPGYHARWRCLLLSHLEVEYDKLLAQADNFSLEKGATVRIWGGRMRSLVPEKICPDYEPGGADVTGCLACIGGVCLNRLPACPGVCRKFKRRGGKQAETTGPEGA